MKKVIKRVSVIGIALMCLLNNFCFGVNTIADGMLRTSRTMMKDAETETTKTSNYWPIIIGIAIAIIVVIAIIIVKNKKKKETKNEE